MIIQILDKSSAGNFLAGARRDDKMIFYGLTKIAMIN